LSVIRGVQRVARKRSISFNYFTCLLPLAAVNALVHFARWTGEHCIAAPGTSASSNPEVRCNRLAHVHPQ